MQNPPLGSFNVLLRHLVVRRPSLFQNPGEVGQQILLPDQLPVRPAQRIGFPLPVNDDLVVLLPHPGKQGLGNPLAVAVKQFHVKRTPLLPALRPGFAEPER